MVYLFDSPVIKFILISPTLMYIGPTISLSRETYKLFSSVISHTQSVPMGRRLATIKGSGEATSGADQTLGASGAPSAGDFYSNRVLSNPVDDIARRHIEAPTVLGVVGVATDIVL